MPRFTVDFGQDVDKILGDLAEATGSTKAEVVRRAISSYKFLKSNTPDKKIVLMDQNNKTMTEVVFP